MMKDTIQLENNKIILSEYLMGTQKRPRSIFFQVGEAKDTHLTS